MKTSGIGGQAVIEGVMMKNGSKYAVAVRKPNGEIEVSVKGCADASKRSLFFRLPIIRGVVAFIDSLTIGMRTLSYSASFFEEEEKDTELSKKLNKQTNEKKEGALNVLTMMFSVVLALVIFVLLPSLVSSYISPLLFEGKLDALVEGIVRIAIFILYIVSISQLEDIKRMFMYHGAEHKVINCIEHGRSLTVDNARRASREHKRCGTSFMLNVMLISIIIFSFLKFDVMWIKLVTRIAFIPVIAGISYEFTRLAGRKDNFLINILSRPGLILQGLTTKEPDDSMLEVAIRSVEAVYDWRPFVESIKKETRRAAEENKEVSAPIDPKAFTPKEAEVSQFFDVTFAEKTEDSEKRENKKDKKKKEEKKTKEEVKLVVDREDDELLAALDFMFDHGDKNTAKSSREDANTVVTASAVEAVDDGYVSGENIL